ncbi:MAG: chorismate mutase [Chloroflexi bacterium]|jgi:chorismate mutase|nr:chorismate mutase [Chloroflexota bacterium]
MLCRGIRGATTVDSNTKEDILNSAKELLQKMIDANGLQPENVACAIFTTTHDLNAEFPAAAARQLGWAHPALLCAQEMNVPGSLQRCLRILILYNTEKSAEEIVHVYIKGATTLKGAASQKK